MKLTTMGTSGAHLNPQSIYWRELGFHEHPREYSSTNISRTIIMSWSVEEAPRITLSAQMAREKTRAPA